MSYTSRVNLLQSLHSDSSLPWSRESDTSPRQQDHQTKDAIVVTNVHTETHTLRYAHHRYRVTAM